MRPYITFFCSCITFTAIYTRLAQELAAAGSAETAKNPPMPWHQARSTGLDARPPPLIPLPCWEYPSPSRAYCPGKDVSSPMTTAFFRTIILYLLLMVGLRLLGKRQIGELEPSELVLTLIISDLAAVPMQDFGIPLVNGVFPIVVLLCLSMILSFINLKSVRFRAILCGKPAIIIRDGQLVQQAMSKTRLTIDELYEQLRGQGITDLKSVKYAILETNGRISALPYTQENPATPKALGIQVQDETLLPILLINDGRVMGENLRSSGRDRTWLEQQLKARDIRSPKEVFLLSVDEAGKVECVKKEVRP